jgi:hypothetical protein
MAPELFDSAAFGPDALKVSGRAFDEAWASIAGSFHDPLTVQATRLKLANPILAAGKANGPDDVGLSCGKGPTRAAALRVKDRTSGDLYYDNKHASMKAQ